MTKKYRHNEATGEVYAYVDSAKAYVYIGKVIRGRRSLKRVIKEDIDWKMSPGVEKFWLDEAKEKQNDSHLWQIDLTNKQVEMIRSAVKSHEPWDKEWESLYTRLLLNFEKRS